MDTGVGDAEYKQLNSTRYVENRLAKVCGGLEASNANFQFQFTEIDITSHTL